jgi:hypothetical protein
MISVTIGKIEFYQISLAISLAILCALLPPNAATVSARETGPVWHQTEDRRPRADSSWATIKRDTLEIGVEHLGGIGKTEFVLEQGQWPPKLRLVFRHFKALEGFKIWTASNKFESSIAVSNQQPVIDLGRGFTAKKKGDFIYIYGPSRFIKKNDKSIHVEWVDFYRN